MVYIVSDERIAVENFEQGKIYKVDFVDESVLYGVCVGIGSDFVMLSGDISGYIFPLTMQTASQVSSIDLYDPTPPEPPVPWTNLLQYQTDEPPFTFNTTDEELFSWYIVGEGVGDKTANLFTTIGATSGYLRANGEVVEHENLMHTDYIAIPTGATELTQSYGGYQTAMNAPALCFYDSNKSYISGASFNNLYEKTFSVPNNAKYIRTCYRTIMPWVMLNTGSTALPFEPWGYKIPILCNEHLTNIYLDAPLSEGEILYSTDIDTAIVTDIGDNELSVETTQQPTAMQIVYKIADR